MRGLIPVTIVVVTAAVGANQQRAPADAALAFDVVSIRRNQQAETERASAAPGVIIPPASATVLPGGRLAAAGISLRELIRHAYGYQRRPPADVSGGPGWVDTERYDLNAQAAGEFGAAPPGQLPPRAAAMLKTMLAERFQLRIRTETQERPIFELVTTRPDKSLGERLKPSKGDCYGIYATNPPPSMPPCPFRIGGGEGFDVGNLTMPEFAMWLSVFPAVNASVVDKTGLQGGYDITLRFRGIQQALTGTGAASNDYPILVDALPQQLNLKLERIRGPVDVLIVERAERPSAN
jgi:uncharacterized protein (TIGR03435 family)